MQKCRNPNPAIFPRLVILGLVVVLVWPLPRVAAEDAVPLSGIPDRAIDGQTIALTDGRVLRLESIQAPFLSADHDRVRSWPLAEMAHKTLGSLMGPSQLTIQPAAQPLDRFGRLVGQAYRPDGTWLQAELVRLGLARVAGSRANHGGLNALLRLEDEARRQALGLWDLEFYAVRDHEDLDQLIGTFQLVEGRVTSVARIKGRIFLNFGDNWRTDFTITVAPKDRRRIEDDGFDFSTLKEKRVRIRGWLGERNGPVIEMDHRAQLEVLS